MTINTFETGFFASPEGTGEIDYRRQFFYVVFSHSVPVFEISMHPCMHPLSLSLSHTHLHTQTHTDGGGGGAHCVQPNNE